MVVHSVRREVGGALCEERLVVHSVRREVGDALCEEWGLVIELPW